MEDLLGCRQIAFHRLTRGRCILPIGPRAKLDECRHTIAQGDTIRPKPGRATVAIGEGMDLHPARMGPRTEPQHFHQLIDIGNCCTWRDEGVQAINTDSKLFLEGGKFIRDILRFGAGNGPHPNANVFQTLFPSESANVRGIVDRETIHEDLMPVARVLDRKFGSP